ncbi:hypothetical protein ACX0HA_16735 [Flavobacterium hauense]
MKKIAELTLEELSERKSKLKGVLIGYGILIVIAVLLLIYLHAKPMLFVPVLVLPVVVLPLFLSLKMTMDEIAKRKELNNPDLQ